MAKVIKISDIDIKGEVLEPMKNMVALVIKPKQPMVDWLNKCEGKKEYTLERLQKEHEKNIYVLKEADVENWEGIVAINYMVIFLNQLFEWFTDPNMYPEIEGPKMLFEWFDFELSSMMYDLRQNIVLKWM